MTDDAVEARRVWTRRELEEAEAADRPEGQSFFKVAITPKLLLVLIDYAGDKKGETVEVVAGYGDPTVVQLKFFHRDKVDAEMRARHAAFPYPSCVERKGGCPDHPWLP